MAFLTTVFYTFIFILKDTHVTSQLKPFFTFSNFLANASSPFPHSLLLWTVDPKYIKSWTVFLLTSVWTWFFISKTRQYLPHSLPDHFRCSCPVKVKWLIWKNLISEVCLNSYTPFSTSTICSSALSLSSSSSPPVILATELYPATTLQSLIPFRLKHMYSHVTLCSSLFGKNAFTIAISIL